MEMTTVRIAVEADMARVRQIADTIAGSLGLQDFARTRTVTAILEIARNALQYAGGGQVKFSANHRNGKSYLNVRVIDQGEGIGDAADKLDDAHPYRAKAKGTAAGLGLGLQGAKRLADRLDIQTSAEGTLVDMDFRVPIVPMELAARVREATDELIGIGETDPVAELSRQNRELAEAMAERELLIEEVHHRTGNNLALIVSFIQMSKRSATLPETKQVLTELESRVHSVARVHHELQRSRNADRIDILPFLKSVAEHARDAFSTSQCKITIDVGGDHANVTSSAVIDLGLIVGELITNAIKHAFPGRSEGHIDIRFECPETGPPEDDGCSIIVSDDGVGYVEEKGRPDRPQSLGWRMIRAMSARHGGTIETDGSDGFTVKIGFPPDLVPPDPGDD